MKKILALVFSVLMVLSLALTIGCEQKKPEAPKVEAPKAEAPAPAPAPAPAEAPKPDEAPKK